VGIGWISQRLTPIGIQQGDMMSAIANSVPKPEGFDRYVRKFRSICAMHGVQIGSRTELPGFLQKLLEDRHLAMDFWAFIGKSSNREGGQLSDDQLLGVVVEGITASDLSLEDTGLEPTVDDLRAMLAGVDIHGAEQSSVVMAPFPKPEQGPTEQTEFPNVGADSQHIEAQAWAHAGESAYPTESLHAGESTQSADTSTGPAPSARKKVDGDVDHPVVLPTPPGPLHLDESRLRLELTRLVQEYFDNIDKRIAKLEPHPAPAVVPRSLDEPASEAEEEELRLRRMGRSRLVLEPAELPGEILLAAKDVKRPIRIPLEHYSPPPRFGRAPLILVLVLIGAGFEIYRDPSLLRHMYAAVIHHFRNDPPQDRATDSPPPARSYDLAPTSSEPSLPAVVSSATGTTPIPLPTDTANQSPSADSRTAENRPDSSSHAADRAPVQSGQATDESLSSIETAGAVKVSSSVMDRNLIVSRVPAYPEFAKQSRVQGDVVMQALISKDGTVKRVHVTEGDSRLRIAAEEAVYKWRYRPYVLNGQPVEVATTVTVNFNLNR
jgi:TonB family protein